MPYETLLIEIKDQVALVRLNRPQALNALNSQLMQELADALSAMDHDPEVRCIVLTGSEKAFAAGADIKEMAQKSFAEMFTEALFAEEFDAIGRLRKPIIAAVSGFCLGGGCELAMLCDFILAADTARFGQPEINLGVMAGLGGTQRLTRLIGKSKAMEMNLTGRMMDATEAERAGLVARIVPAAELIEEALKTAAKIAAKSQIATMAVKESVNRALETTLHEGLIFERRLFNALFATEDQAEGMAAFIEKRPPAFKDR
ncbi:MAG: enoyl-CoA hydratase [Cypionkella sp.]